MPAKEGFYCFIYQERFYINEMMIINLFIQSLIYLIRYICSTKGNVID